MIPGDDTDPDDAQTLLQQASLAGVAALGHRAGRMARRLQVHAGRAFPLPPHCAGCDGYNLHASVRIRAFDRQGLERLCRYVSRPPWAALPWRTFEVDPLVCPLCGRPMRLRTVVLPPASLDVLAGLHASAARGPPPLVLPLPTAPAAGVLPAASRPPGTTIAR